MTLKDAISLKMTTPSGTQKTDIILYKHNRGRLNYWTLDQKTGEKDIISYYLEVKNDCVNVLDDKGLCKIISF